MANPKHLEILKQGVEAWNACCDEHSGVTADLENADLSGVQLYEPEIGGINLDGAKLNGAKLQAANLSGAWLQRADLSGAHLAFATLQSTRLSRADLSGAKLYETNFQSAEMLEANLSDAVAWDTVFADNDLSTAIGLETIKHIGPSTIGIDTIYKSKGNIPEAFLRGCGVPENFIEYMGSLTGAAFEYYSCFISHASKDMEFAQRLHNDLQAKAVRCWFAPEDLKIGDVTRQAIDGAIRIHDKLLLILSEK